METIRRLRLTIHRDGRPILSETPSYFDGDEMDILWAIFHIESYTPHLPTPGSSFGNFAARFSNVAKNPDDYSVHIFRVYTPVIRHLTNIQIFGDNGMAIRNGEIILFIKSIGDPTL